MATMETVYKPEKIPWVSPVVRNVAEEFALIRSRVKKFFPFRDSATRPPACKAEVKSVSDMLTCDPDRVLQVLTLCSSSSLGGPYGLLPDTEDCLYKPFRAPIPPAGDKEGLRVLRVREDVEEGIGDDLRFRADMFENRRYRRRETANVEDLKRRGSGKEGCNRVPKELADVKGKEIVVHVKIFDVSDPELTPKIVVLRKQPIEKCREELVFLGSQTLADLHERIKCPRKNLIEVDYSDDPRKFNATQHAEKVALKNACAVLFIHDTLYASNIQAFDDYVQPIQAWALENADVLNPPVDDAGAGVGVSNGHAGESPVEKKQAFKQALMSECTFVQLTLRFGYPYVYVHGNSCHHVVMISFARLYSKIEDWKFRSDYPVRRRYRRVARRICRICARQTGCWLVKGHPDFPDELTAFCETCLYSVLYNVTKQRIGDTNEFKISVKKKGNFRVFRSVVW